MPGDPLNGFAESARNLVWIGLLYSLSAAGEERQHGVRLVYGAVAAVVGMQLIAQLLGLFQPSEVVAETNLILHITDGGRRAGAGPQSLWPGVPVEPVAHPAGDDRSGLAVGLRPQSLYAGLSRRAERGGPRRVARRGGCAHCAIVRAGARDESGWRIRLSRAATFQSLSLLAICAYFALMAIVATALRGSGFDWSGALMIGVLAVMTVGAMVVIPSARARGWIKVKLAKHLFEHRYDYRSEWLRFTGTLGRAGPDAPPLSERIVQAFADVVDSPGGMLLVSDEGRGLAVAATWNWPSAAPPADQMEDCAAFWGGLEASGRILEFEGLRSGWAGAPDKALPTPPWMIADGEVWAGVPLIHNERMVGLVILAAPEFRRHLDWEDFDLLRTAGNQAASSLAEAFGQQALVNAQRFEEFNRRFAFILHDIKNLVSQLSLLARNAERHADNPEFRADMVGTLQSSVGKMRDLLARLAPQSMAEVQNVERAAAAADPDRRNRRQAPRARGQAARRRRPVGYRRRRRTRASGRAPSPECARSQYRQ